jgi:hypothetical protein
MWMTWSEKIEEKGRKEGLRLGQTEGMRTLLLHLLAQRFGPLSEAVRRQVEEITSTRRLTSLAGKVLTARSLRDLGFC